MWNWFEQNPSTLKVYMRRVMTTLVFMSVTTFAVVVFWSFVQLSTSRIYQPLKMDNPSYYDPTNTRRTRCERDMPRDAFTMYTWLTVDGLVSMLTSLLLLSAVGVSFWRASSASHGGSVASVAFVYIFCVFMISWTIPGFLHLMKYSSYCREVFVTGWKTSFWFIIIRWILIAVQMVCCFQLTTYHILCTCTSFGSSPSSSTDGAVGSNMIVTSSVVAV